ncbi:hypothetical protein E1A91_D08G075700v1 [Gossypium mustelinum]|uniref:Uncharacterized protein n=1 Tax=Gossypium mustelinum TaxID=34275 RepID=A0A5D2TU70_GOSMU|nr:hypothetical protein E1A91_D08G075700v1 [Gossypium mustelinum]
MAVHYHTMVFRCHLRWCRFLFRVGFRNSKVAYPN